MGPAGAKRSPGRRLFEPTKEAYLDGEVVNRRVVFHNSAKALCCSRSRWAATTTAGRSWMSRAGTALEHVTYTGLVRLMAFRLQPGHAVELDCMSTGLGASAKVDHPADTAIQAKPGTTCHVSWALRVSETTAW